MANFAIQISAQRKKYSKRIEFTVTLTVKQKKSRWKRQIKQQTHPLEVQEAIPAVECNDLEAAWREANINIIDM